MINLETKEGFTEGDGPKLCLKLTQAKPKPRVGTTATNKKKKQKKKKKREDRRIGMVISN